MAGTETFLASGMPDKRLNINMPAQYVSCETFKLAFNAIQKLLLYVLGIRSTSRT
jgi:hypothetical protein